MDKYINQIICGDNVKVLRKFPAQCIDLIVTSPPYDNLRDYEGYNFDYKKLGLELYHIIKPGGVLVWVVGDKTVNGSETGTSFKQALYFKEIGFNLHDTMIYVKDGFPFPEANRYQPIFEYMFVFSFGSPSVFNPIRKKNKWGGQIEREYERGVDGAIYSSGMRYSLEEGNLGNVWLYGTGYMKTTKDKNCYEHPAMFPEHLARDHILSWSNEGDIVLDPMCGSGTTCKMAYRYKRKFIGIDISEKYCKIARKRLRDEMAQMRLDI